MGRATLGVAIAYAVVNALLLWATVPGANLTYGADAQSWYRPAVALYEHGAFVRLDHPTEPETYRGPGFPIFGAAMMRIAGEAGPMPIVYGQIVLLLLAGLMFRRIVEEWCPRWGDLGLALFVFNPNVLATAHLVQSDTLFVAIMMGAFWTALRFIRCGHDWRYGVATGGLLGLASLVRPTPEFLLLALPLVLPLLVLASGTVRGTGRAALAGLGGIVVAGVIALPWIAHVHAAGGGFDLTPPDIKFRYVWDQVEIASAQRSGVSQQAATRRIEGPGGVIDRYVAAQGSAWNALSLEERYARLVDFGYRTLLSKPPAALARALAQSVGQFLMGAGAGNYFNLLGIEAGKLSKLWLTQSTGRPLDAVRQVLAGAPLSMYAIGAVAYGFVLLVRLAALVGLAALAFRRQWPLLVLLVGMVAYFAGVCVFVGSARYRLAVEPALLLPAVMGIREMVARLGRRRASPAGLPGRAA